MKKWKSIISLFLVILFVLSLSGCKKGDENPEHKEEKTTEEKISRENESDESMEVSIADELEYYYLSLFYQTYSLAYSYETQYGEGTGKMLTGYDYKLSPDKQSTKNEAGETITFAEYFYESAVREMAMSKYSAEFAVASGISLTEGEKKDIEDAATEFASNEFVQKFYNTAVVNKVHQKVITDKKYTEHYKDMIRDKCNNAKEISSIYTEDKIKYDVVDFRWFVIENDSSAASEATAFINKVTSVGGYNEETFKSVVLEFIGEDHKDYEAYKSDAATEIKKIDKQAMELNVSKDAADWFFETDENDRYVRKSGDIRYFLSGNGENIYILYATGTPYRDDDTQRSVRHILLMDSTIEDAQKVLDEYNSKAGNNFYEEYFIELVKKYSDDTGTKNNGGLIENMKNDGQYVTAFEDWAFAEGEFSGQERKIGTTGIVESEYGYHIMLYLSENENPLWYEEILAELVSEEWEKINSENVDVDEFEKQYIGGEIKESIKEKCVETIKNTFGYI
jgi:hypothetical protein